VTLVFSDDEVHAATTRARANSWAASDSSRKLAWAGAVDDPGGREAATRARRRALPNHAEQRERDKGDLEMGSAAERKALAHEFERHIEEEGEIVEKYHALSDKLTDDRLSVLVNHIATEEEMHHFLLRTLADWLQAPAPRAETRVASGPDRDELLRVTRMLRGHEKKTTEACRGLKSRLSDDEGELFEAVLDAIILDSEKHHRLLATVEKLIGG
jgi:rubrerythrin